MIAFSFIIGRSNVQASGFKGFITENANERYSNQEYTEKNISAIKSMDINDERTYAKIAMDFAKSVKPNKELKISEMIPIYDVNKEFVGYNCKMTLDGKDNGYVTVDNRMVGDYIAEFNLEENSRDLFSNMIQSASEHTNEASNIKSEDKVIIESDVATYNVNIGDTVVSTSGEVLESEEFISENDFFSCLA